MGHHIFTNATGFGAKYLSYGKDDKMLEVRGQTVLVKSPYNKLWVRRGKEYTYHLPRGDGMAILGGIKDFGSTTREVNQDQKNDILRRIHEGLPQAFPSAEASSFEVVRDLVGIRPPREGGVRIAREIVDGQNVVHAYGVETGGYVSSWGVGKEVAKLVSEFEFGEVTDSLSIVSRL
ncbi:Fc.00g097670.m01.CDS01 [Cosmosporella sp. VM-42]